MTGSKVTGRRPAAGVRLLPALFALAAIAAVLAAQFVFAADPKAKRAAPPDDNYQPGPDSQRQPGVPAGKVFQFTFDKSNIFPGTVRTISVYVPAQYKADKPACVYVGLDGLGFAAPVVFDNLIHKKEIPVSIGIGIQSGRVPSAQEPENPRFNRSFEFDGLNDNLGRFLVEEIFPEVERRKTPDGLWLAVAEETTHWGTSWRVRPDGSLDQKQRFYWFHVPDRADDSGARAWCADREGRLYAATRMGVQVFDRNGRTRAILPLPAGQVTGVCFGGEKFDTLFVACDGRVWKRKLKVAGAPPWIAPLRLPPWGAG